MKGRGQEAEGRGDGKEGGREGKEGRTRVETRTGYGDVLDRTLSVCPVGG